MIIYNKNLEIFINRNKLFYDAYEHIMYKNPFELKKQLRIKYKEEEGVDAGGLLKYYNYYLYKIITKH